jgi:hypothetical protein
VKVAQTHNELLGWIQDLNPGQNTRNWRVPGEQTEPKGWRLILHIDQDSLVSIQKTENKIFTGLTQGTVKILKDSELQKGRAPETTSSDSGSEEEGNVKPTPSNNRKRTTEAGEENAPSALPDLSDQGTSSKGKGREGRDGDRPSLSSNLRMKYTHTT